MVLAGSHSGLLLLPATFGQILRDQEETVTPWSQKTEVFSLGYKTCNQQTHHLLYIFVDYGLCSRNNKTKKKIFPK